MEKRKKCIEQTGIRVWVKGRKKGEWTNRQGERHVEKEERKKRVDKQTRGKAC